MIRQSFYDKLIKDGWKAKHNSEKPVQYAIPNYSNKFIGEYTDFLDFSRIKIDVQYLLLVVTEEPKIIEFFHLCRMSCIVYNNNHCNTNQVVRE